ncbi:hypothetical protein [Bacillus horti]|uniref:Uncharacterized protein n=1 Tax=Caldalkalibacillus horti TaxID=77523 RepID=A0ABT9VTY1_9BACI|nr:hypothetical protein [Bacillus horti]MDQ0164437.1 hypothetical protein [Bacillus horti]
MKGWFIISSSKLEPTASMETALYQAHGISYAQYENCFETQLKVERQREKDYEESMRLCEQFDRKLK